MVFGPNSEGCHRLHSNQQRRPHQHIEFSGPDLQRGHSDQGEAQGIAGERRIDIDHQPVCGIGDQLHVIAEYGSPLHDFSSCGPAGRCWRLWLQTDRDHASSFAAAVPPHAPQTVDGFSVAALHAVVQRPDGRFFYLLLPLLRSSSALLPR
jgi:hypothetical protein